MFLTDFKLFSVPIDYMQYLLEYLYTAQCSIPVSELDDVSRYASQLKMHDFVDLLNHEFSVFTEWSKLKVSYSYISLRLTHFQPTVSPIRSIDLFGDKEILKSDLLNSEHFDIELTNGFGDVIQGHRAVFLSRSDYFGALFTDHFHESDQSDESNEYFGKFRNRSFIREQAKSFPIPLSHLRLVRNPNRCSGYFTQKKYFSPLAFRTAC